MKKFKLILALLVSTLLMSCTEVGIASIENSLVVEQVKATENKSNCSTCLTNVYKYRVKFKTNTGSVYYYTDYKHEVGDSLLSIFEFKENREILIKKEIEINDSLVGVNNRLAKKNDELELYNSLLMGIIQENALKTK